MEAVVVYAYLVACGVACIIQPKTPLPSLTETYRTLASENGVEEVLVEGRQKFPFYKKLNLLWWFLNESESARPTGIIRSRILVCDCCHGICAIHCRTPATMSSACVTAILPSVVSRRQC